MAFSFPPPPKNLDPKSIQFQDWFQKLRMQFVATVTRFIDLDFTGSNLTSILTRDHNDLTSKQGGTAGQFYHVTSAGHSFVSSVNISSPTTSQVLTYNGTNWVNAAPGSSGTVSSVALSLPSIFSVSGSPVTTSGTLTGTLATQSVNTVFSGPSSGGSATPTFRSLVAADITGLQGTGLTSTDVGFRIIPQNSQSTNYTTVASDSGKHLLHPSSDANARTFTIDSNANVAYPVGTAITFVNQTSQVLSIAITSDTLTLAGSTTTGTRSLAQNGMATAVKVASTSWIISGQGLT